MSASLVGSEMCIRDRWDECAAPWAPHSPQNLRPRGGSGQPQRKERRTSAVSYTHLTLPTICSV
eukprot:588193-Alexandrium_andersonii.AAC.1